MHGRLVPQYPFHQLGNSAIRSLGTHQKISGLRRKKNNTTVGCCTPRCGRVIYGGGSGKDKEYSGSRRREGRGCGGGLLPLVAKQRPQKGTDMTRAPVLDPDWARDIGFLID